jgi:hypothetical protein
MLVENTAAGLMRVNHVYVSLGRFGKFEVGSKASHLPVRSYDRRCSSST